jgi:hypothetical protein
VDVVGVEVVDGADDVVVGTEDVEVDVAVVAVDAVDVSTARSAEPQPATSAVATTVAAMARCTPRGN